MTDLYRVHHTRPQARYFHEWQKTGFALPVDEKVPVAQVPLEKLRDVLSQLHHYDVEVEPLGDSPAVCSECQFQLAVEHGMCGPCEEHMRELGAFDEPEVA